MDFALPPVGEGLYEVELVRWEVAPGDAVARGQSLMEVLSDKATMHVYATFAGKVTELCAEAGSKIKVGQLVLRFASSGASSAETPILGTGTASAPVASAATPAPARTALENGHPAPSAAGTTATLPAAAPSVRHLARKLGVDLARVRGSGPAGRILLEDLAGFLQPTNATPTRPKTPEPPAIDLGQPGTRQKLMGLRRKIAERMVESSRNVPHYSYVDECDLTDLSRMRGQLKETFNRVGVKLTYLPFIIKAVTRALKQVPVANSTFSEANSELTIHDHYNIGFAVAAPQGLIVPVIKDADKKDIAAIATELERLSHDARTGQSKLEDLRGGTFTVTSVGNIGGLISTPIINVPEVGIMGVGKVVKRPIYDANGALRPADMLYLSFSFDHRVVDGAVCALFGNAVIRQLQNPAALLLPERFAG